MNMLHPAMRQAFQVFKHLWHRARVRHVYADASKCAFHLFGIPQGGVCAQPDHRLWQAASVRAARVALHLAVVSPQQSQGRAPGLSVCPQNTCRRCRAGHGRQGHHYLAPAPTLLPPARPLPFQAAENGNAFAIFPPSPAKSIGIVLMVAHQLVAFGLFILPVGASNTPVSWARRRQNSACTSPILGPLCCCRRRRLLHSVCC